MSDLPKYKNPRWVDKETRRVWCEILVGERYHQCNINAGNPEEGLVNKDFDNIMEEFGEEVLDENTKLYEENLDEDRKKAEEAREVHINRIKQETLFEMKLEAFEIDLIKESPNKELKKLLRKAKTVVEVQAYATLLLQEAISNSE